MYSPYDMDLEWPFLILSRHTRSLGGHDRSRTYSPSQERGYNPPRLSNFAACPYCLVASDGLEPSLQAYETRAGTRRDAKKFRI